MQQVYAGVLESSVGQGGGEFAAWTHIRKHMVAQEGAWSSTDFTGSRLKHNECRPHLARCLHKRC